MKAEWWLLGAGEREGNREWLLNGQGFLWGWWKHFGIRQRWWLHDIANILNCSLYTELFPLKWLISCYVNLSQFFKETKHQKGLATEKVLKRKCQRQTLPFQEAILPQIFINKPWCLQYRVSQHNNLLYVWRANTFLKSKHHKLVVSLIYIHCIYTFHCFPWWKGFENNL